MEMYDALFQDGVCVEINDFPFFVESCSSDECFNRRELNRTNLVGGTQIVTRGAYIPRTYTVTTHVRCPPDRPDIYDNIFREMMSKPCGVISPEIGGQFNAEVIVNREHETPDYLKLTFSITEIPDLASNIPNESFTKPPDKLMTESERAEYEERKAKKLEEAKKVVADDKGTENNS